MIQTRDLCKAPLNSSLSPFFIFSSSVGKKEKFNSHIVTCDNWFITCRKLKVITFLCLPDRNVQTSVSEFVQVPCKTFYGVAILHCLEVFIYSVIEGGFYIFQVGCPVVWT